MWNIALSDTQIADVFSVGIDHLSTELVGYWTFDEGTGQAVADLSQAGNHGFLGETPGVDSADPLWQGTPVSQCGLDADYTDGMLTMHFELGMPEPATWSVWMFLGEFIFPLWAISLPAIDPPISFPVSFPFPAGFRRIILVTTLSTAEQGITCFDFAFVGSSTL